MHQEFRREYLLRLPLPLAQLYSRAFNAKDARERHDNAFYLFEATVKLLASTSTACYLEEITRGKTPRLPRIDRLLAQLALPSLGQWLAILRELARYFSERVDAAAHPWGVLFHALELKRTDAPGLLALFRRIKNGPDGESAGNQSCSLLEVLDALVQYRNGVFGHGAGRFESFYAEEMGPLLFPAANDMLADGFLHLLGPPSARLVYLTELRILDDGRTQVGVRDLVGTQGERLPPLEVEGRIAEGLLPHRIGLLWPGRTAPLRLDPLLQYRESELSEEVLFLNRDRNGRQVEYLSYTTGRTERDRSMLPALAAMLSDVTNREIQLADLDRLLEQSLSETPSVESLLVGPEPPSQTMGEYELLSEIGRGGMGVVYLARQKSLGRLVALKMLPQDLAGDELSILRFQREIRHLARCDSPHIVKVLDSGTLPDGRMYYTMEYVPGSDLEMVWRELSGGTGNASASTLGNGTWTQAVHSATLKHKRRAEGSRGKSSFEQVISAEPDSPPVPSAPALQIPDLDKDPGGYVRRVVSLIRDVARALHTIHEQGIIHRDVKPANLMLTPDGTRIVLMDFGLAKGQSNALTASRQGGLLGTLRYAAPEQLAAANIKIGPAVDVRGLGVTLWELLTRKRLFGEAEDEVRLTQDVLTSDVPRLRSMDPKLDRDLDAIVARATERRLTDRISSASQLADLLQLWLDGKPLPIRPPGMGELLLRWGREHAVFATAATILTVMALVTGWMAYRTWSRQKEESRGTAERIQRQASSLEEHEIQRAERDMAAQEVDLATLLAMVPTMERQVTTLRSELVSASLLGPDRSLTEQHLRQLEGSFATLKRRVESLQQILAARSRRFDVTDESFQLADGMPGAYGRDGIPIYRQAFASLAGEDILDSKRSTGELAEILQKHGLTHHLRNAADDWLILSYRADELEIRRRLGELADAMDAGPQKSTRAAIRKAVLDEDAATLLALVPRYREARELSADSAMTAMLLVDGLMESLHLREGMDVLRQVKTLGPLADPPIPPFLRMWANDVLGVLLNFVGSREEVYEAIQCFEAAFAIDPTLDVFRLNIASSYIKLCRPDEALASLEWIKDPSLDTMTRIVRGVALADGGRGDDARVVAAELMKDKPDSILAHFGAAVIFAEAYDLDKEIAAAKQGLQLDAENPQLMEYAYSDDERALNAALEKVPRRRLNRCWKARYRAQVVELRGGFLSQDFPRVAAAREALRLLGVQDWNLSLLEYQALFEGRNWNGASWEKPLRDLRKNAPDFVAEALPSPMLGALLEQRGSLSNRATQRLLLREADAFPTVHPLARLNRLISSATLLEEVEPLMSVEFLEAAIRRIPEIKSAGFGSDGMWSNLEEQFAERIQSMRLPANEEASLPEEKRDLAASHRLFGRAKLEAGELKEARDHFDKYAQIALELANAAPDDLELQAELSHAYSWLAHVASDSGAIEEAIEFGNKDIAIAERVAHALPEDEQAQIDLARAYKSMGDLQSSLEEYSAAVESTEKAVRLYRQLAVAKPTDGGRQHWLFLSLSALGTHYLDLDQLDDARRFLIEGLPLAESRAQSAPNNAIAQSDLAILQAHLGQVEIKAGKDALALEYFRQFQVVAEKMLASYPGDVATIERLTQAYGWIGVSYQRLGKMDEARGFYEKEIEFARKSLIVSEDVAEARTSLARALGDRAHYLRKAADLPGSLHDLDEALGLAPQFADLWSQRGNVHFDMRNFENALADYDKSLELAPTNDEYLRNRANVHGVTGHVEAAEKDYAAAIAAGKDSVFNWHCRAEYYAYQKRYDESAADFAQCLQLEPNDPFLWNSAGIVQTRLGHFDEAVAKFRRALETLPDEPKFHRNLGSALAQLNQWAEAMTHYDIAMEAEYAFPSVWSEAALVAKSLADNGKYESIMTDLALRFSAAKEAVDPTAVAWALARFPPSPEIAAKLEALFGLPEQNGAPDPLDPFYRGVLLLRLEKWAEADKSLRTYLASDVGAQDYWTHLYLAITAVRLGNSNESQKLLKEARYLANAESTGAALGWVDRTEQSLLFAEAEGLAVK